MEACEEASVARPGVFLPATRSSCDILDPLGAAAAARRWPRLRQPDRDVRPSPVCLPPTTPPPTRRTRHLGQFSSFRGAGGDAPQRQLLASRLLGVVPSLGAAPIRGARRGGTGAAIASPTPPRRGARRHYHLHKRRVRSRGLQHAKGVEFISALPLESSDDIRQSTSDGTRDAYGLDIWRTRVDFVALGA
jgi:hypothetical protein